jgi:hypothetical protein
MDANPHSDVPDDRLARLLAVGTGGESGWRPEEMGAVFAHQSSATVEFELGGLRPPAAQRLASLSAAQGLLVRSFRDLFRHPCPPIELLVLTKDYAKRLLGSDDSPPAAGDRPGPLLLEYPRRPGPARAADQRAG